MYELRSIEDDFIGSIDGLACEDPVFCAEQRGFGPYNTENEFNEGLIRAMTINQTMNSWINHVAKLIRAMPSHTTVLTHADFSPRNILISGERVVGILDLEMAGYYPEYWEYIKAMYRPDWQSRWIEDDIVDTTQTILSRACCHVTYATDCLVTDLFTVESVYPQREVGKSSVEIKYISQSETIYLAVIPRGVSKKKTSLKAKERAK